MNGCAANSGLLGLLVHEAEPTGTVQRTTFRSREPTRLTSGSLASGRTYIGRSIAAVTRSTFCFLLSGFCEADTEMLPSAFSRKHQSHQPSSTTSHQRAGQVSFISLLFSRALAP